MAHLLLKDTVISDRRLPLPGKVVVLGRSLDVDVPVPHVSVSRRHALIEQTADGFTLSDLGSSNGTFVDGERLPSGDRREIAFGSPFRLGEVVFRLSPDEVLGEEIHPAPIGGAVQAAPVPARTMVAPTPDELPPPPVVNVSAVSRPRPGAGSPKQNRARPSLARRGAVRKQRQDAMKWVGVLVTILLVTLAGVFLVKIVGKSSASDSDDRASEENSTEKKDDPKSWKIRSIGEEPEEEPGD